MRWRIENVKKLETNGSFIFVTEQSTTAKFYINFVLITHTHKHTCVCVCIN